MTGGCCGPLCTWTHPQGHRSRRLTASSYPRTLIITSLHDGTRVSQGTQLVFYSTGDTTWTRRCLVIDLAKARVRRGSLNTCITLQPAEAYLDHVSVMQQPKGEDHPFMDQCRARCHLTIQSLILISQMTCL